MIAIDNWKPSIIRTVAGNSSYRFQNQVFESDKLRIEVKLLNLNIQTQILPLELTIEYQENIRNELFSITPDLRKSIVEIVQPIQPYTFKLSISNTNKSPVSVLVSLPKIKLRPKFVGMPFFPEEQGQDPAVAALIAAQQATNDSIASLSQVILNTSSAEIEALSNAQASENDLTVLNPVITAIGTTPSLISSANDANRGLLINNQGNTKIKLFATDDVLSPTTGYNSGGHIFEMTTKGVYEVPEAFVKTNVYAVGNVANGSVSVTRSVKTPLPTE